MNCTGSLACRPMAILHCGRCDLHSIDGTDCLDSLIVRAVFMFIFMYADACAVASPTVVGGDDMVLNEGR